MIPSLPKSLSWEWYLLALVVAGSFVLGLVFGG